LEDDLIDFCKDDTVVVLFSSTANHCCKTQKHTKKRNQTQTTHNEVRVEFENALCVVLIFAKQRHHSFKKLKTCVSFFDDDMKPTPFAKVRLKPQLTISSFSILF
jgi:hypothetical protein